MKNSSKKQKKWVIHYNEKDNRFTVVQLKDLEKKNILKMFECYQLDESYVEEQTKDITSVVNIKMLSETFSKVEEYSNLLKDEQKKLDEFYKKIENHMEKNAIKTIELKEFKITHTPPGVRRNVDYTKATEEKNLAKLKSSK